MSNHTAAKPELDLIEIQQAIKRYFEVFGDHAIQPNCKLSTVSRNRTVFLRNVNGTLAIVTSKGLVFERIGGSRLDTFIVSRGA